MVCIAKAQWFTKGCTVPQILLSELSLAVNSALGEQAVVTWDVQEGWGGSALNIRRFFHTVIVRGLQKSWCRLQLYRWKLWVRRNQTRSSLWVLPISVGTDLENPMV